MISSFSCMVRFSFFFRFPVFLAFCLPPPLGLGLSRLLGLIFGFFGNFFNSRTSTFNSSTSWLNRDTCSRRNHTKGSSNSSFRNPGTFSNPLISCEFEKLSLSLFSCVLISSFLMLHYHYLVAITLQTVPPISLHTVPVISLQTVPLSIMNNIVLALLKKQYQHGRKQKKHYGYQTSITTQTKRI